MCWCIYTRNARMAGTPNAPQQQYYYTVSAGVREDACGGPENRNRPAPDKKRRRECIFVNSPPETARKNRTKRGRLGTHPNYIRCLELTNTLGRIPHIPDVYTTWYIYKYIHASV